MRRLARLLAAFIVGAALWQGSVAHATWTIAAVDPATGDVGAAGAGCVDADLLSTAGLVPRHGAVAAQAVYLERGRDLGVLLVEQGKSPVQVLTTLTGPTFDPDAARRQYGVVTTDASAAFSGSKVEPWAGDRNGPGSGGNVVVVVDSATGPEVAQQAYDAFHRTDAGPLHLTDRLVLALEAGSAAGGDKRCNVDGITQTAKSAFLMAARPQDPVFAAPSNTPLELVAGLPWLALSVVNSDNRENPVVEIRAEYDGWRAASLPPCPECAVAAAEVPVGDRHAPPLMDWGDVLGIVVVILAAIVIVAVLGALTVAVLRRRGARRAATDGEADDTGTSTLPDVAPGDVAPGGEPPAEGTDTDHERV